MTGFAQFELGLLAWDATTVAERRPVICDTELPSKVAENTPEQVVTAPPVASVASVADWRAGVDQLKDMTRPDFMERHDWLRLVNDAVMFATSWADRAFALGWSIEEIFGCPSRPWLRRLDPCGVVYILSGNRIGSISDNEIAIVQRDGRALNFRRHDPAVNVPFDRSAAIPIWKAFAQENLACR